MKHTPSDRPACLGGVPIRTTTPRFVDAALGHVFAEFATSAAWSQYHGPYVPRLTEQLSIGHAMPLVTLCCSGTAAVELALRGLGVAVGDEVVMAGYDFKSNFTNVNLLRATPVLVDVRTADFQLDVDQIRAAVTSRTKAVVASHLQGGVVDMFRLRKVADELGVPILEDACQATGAWLTPPSAPPCRAGSLGDVSVLSFGGSKLLTAGRGGAVLTRREDVHQRIKLYNQRGNEAYPLSELQAAVLIPQGELLEERNQLRWKNVVELNQRCGTAGPFRPLWADTFAAGIVRQPAFYKLGFRCVSGDLTRQQWITALKAEGIPLERGFLGLHTIHAQRRFRAVGELTQSTAADREVVILPHSVLLDPEFPAQFQTAIERIQSHAQEVVQMTAPDGDGRQREEERR